MKVVSQTFAKPWSIPRQLQIVDELLCRIVWEAGQPVKPSEFEYTVFFANTLCISINVLQNKTKQTKKTQ